METKNKYGKKACACCGHFTISEIKETCPVCFWEEDRYQGERIDDNGVPNSVSLRHAQEIIKKKESLNSATGQECSQENKNYLMENGLEIPFYFLENGQSFKVGDLRLGISNFDFLTVTGWSQYLTFSNLTKANSIKELEEIKDIFADIVAASVDLKRFIVGRSVEYILCYGDGGKASIDICSEVDGLVTWKVELTKGS